MHGHSNIQYDMFIRMYEDKQFFLWTNILAECVFVTQLSSDMLISF